VYLPERFDDVEGRSSIDLAMAVVPFIVTDSLTGEEIDLLLR